MKSCGRVREANSKTRERKGWTLLMRDTPDYNGIDEPSTDAFFFELEWKEFLREIREDVDSFFGYPSGCPEDSRQAVREYKAMWKQLSKEREFVAGDRRVELVFGTAVVRKTQSP